MSPGTRFTFGLGSDARVRLSILDLAGRPVRVLVDEMRMAGEHHTRWDGIGDQGHRVASGVYFYELRADGRRIDEMKLIVLR